MSFYIPVTRVRYRYQYENLALPEKSHEKKRTSSKPDTHCLHRVDKVLSFFSSRPNWEPPPPLKHTQAHVPPPPFWFRGEGHIRLRERGWDSSNSDEGTDCMYGIEHIKRSLY
jgi:hypothetical protein